MAARLKTVRVEITTDDSGDFTTTTIPLQGGVYQYRYTPDGSNPLDTGADLDIVGADTGIVVANQDDIGTSAFTKAPRQATHGIDGTADDGAALIAINERLTVTIANGGDTLSGVLHIWLAV